MSSTASCNGFGVDYAVTVQATGVKSSSGSNAGKYWNGAARIRDGVGTVYASVTTASDTTGDFQFVSFAFNAGNDLSAQLLIDSTTPDAGVDLPFNTALPNCGGTGTVNIVASCVGTRPTYTVNVSVSDVVSSKPANNDPGTGKARESLVVSVAGRSAKLAGPVATDQKGDARFPAFAFDPHGASSVRFEVSGDRVGTGVALYKPGTFSACPHPTAALADTRPRTGALATLGLLLIVTGCAALTLAGRGRRVIRG